MIGLYLMGLAIVLQFAAAAVALSHIRYTRSYWAWALLSSAMVLQGVRRVSTLSVWLEEGTRGTNMLVSAVLSLLISVLMFGGALLIGPLFKRISGHRDELSRLVDERTEELRAAAEELCDANEELNCMNEELMQANSDLEVVNSKLEQTTRAKDRFVACLSHELRTPLNSIIGFSGWLSSGVPGPVTEEQAKMVSMIRASGDHLLSLINDLLDLEHMRAGGRCLTAEQIDVDALCERVVGMMATQAEAKGLHLRGCEDNSGLKFWGDARAVEQILLNLLTNAVKYTERGVVSLKIKAENDEVLIEVSDTGPGIPSDRLEIIFDEFERLDEERNRTHEGTGLGLPLSRGLARLHGGDITVHSEPDAGSTFCVRLRPLPPHAA